MPKIKTTKKASKSSKLSPFFRKKDNVNLPELHEFLKENSGKDLSHPTSWTDSTILSQTDVYRILQNYKLPSSLEKILLTKDVDVRMHKQQHCISIATTDSIYLYFYQQKSRDSILRLPVEKNLGLSVVHFIESHTSLGVLAVDRDGRVQYWRQYTDKTSLSHQIPLNQTEYITAIKIIPHLQQAIVGSSISNLYLVRLETEEISAFSFYKQKSFIKTLSDLVFRPKAIPSLPDTNSCSILCRGKVLKIDFVEEYVYVAYTKYITVWKINESKIEFLTVLCTESHIQQALSSHVPSHFSKDSIESSLLDICLFSNGVFFILISYSVPEMGDYVQYAIVELKHNRSMLKENTPLLTLQAVSVPYSVVPDSLKQAPKLHVIYGPPLPFAFITFDRTLVAASLDKKFIFEERVALKEANEIMCSQISLTGASTMSALIVTKNDMIEFHIDIDALTDQERVMNIVGSDSIKERDSLLFKSRLEQAVFFGLAENGPLQFPLRTDQGDITEAVTLLVDEISNGCDLLPKSLELGLYVESRYVFSNRIMSALADNRLMYLIPESERFKILKMIEYYHLAIVIYESVNQSFYDAFENTIKHAINVEEDADAIRAFLIDHPLKITLVLDAILRNINVSSSSIDESIQHLKTLQQIVLCLSQRAIKYEEKYIAFYDIKHHFGDLWMVASGSNLLISIFEKIHQCFVSELHLISDVSKVELKEGICVISSFLLEYLSIEVKKSNGDIQKNELKKLKELQDVVIKGLCDCDCFESAIELAEKYHNHFSIIVTIQESQLDEHTKQKKHKRFIDIYGYDYFELLMSWYKNNEKEISILGWSQHMPNFLDRFFEEKSTNVSWIYHVLKEKNTKALIDLKEGLRNESNVYKRCIMLSWAKMLFVADVEDKKSNLASLNSGTVTESVVEAHVLKKLSIDLEFEAIQKEIIGAFLNHLKSMPPHESPTEFILSRCGRISIQRNNQEELDNLKASIQSLLGKRSISKLDVIKLLVMLDNFGSDVENIITALKLTEELENDLFKSFSRIIWSEIYRRDLEHRYVTSYGQLTDIQRQNALQETYTYRVMAASTNKETIPSAFLNEFQVKDVKKLEFLIQTVINSN